MTTLIPFADDAASVSIGPLTVENGGSRVTLYGSLEITRDKAGLAQARTLKALLDQVVQRLEAEPNLPEHVPAAAPTRTVRNPFA